MATLALPSFFGWLVCYHPTRTSWTPRSSASPSRPACIFGTPHIVSAWANEQGIALGQVATDAKSKEVTVIPLLLDQIDLPGTLITIDAMGCQSEIVERIVKGSDDCVIAVKDNQPKLLASIQLHFLDHLERVLEELHHRSHQTGDDKHGRIDERAYYLARTPRDFAPGKDWPWVKAIGYAGRITRQADGTKSDEARCATAKKTAATCRNLLEGEEQRWTILRVRGIEPTNNAAERAFRHAVLWRKSSGGTASEWRSRFVERFLSVAVPYHQQGETSWST